jgi:hypothetical protein
MLSFGDLFLLLFLIKYRFDQEFRPIELEYIQSRIDKVANAAPRWLHAASPEFEILRPIVISDPIFVMYFLKGFQRSAKPFRHHLGVLSDVAVLVSVRMVRFKNKDVSQL